MTITEQNELTRRPKTVEIIDSVNEFVDREISRDRSALTLRAWYGAGELQVAARYLNVMCSHDIHPEDAAKVIVNTIFTAREHKYISVLNNPTREFMGGL